MPKMQVLRNGKWYDVVKETEDEVAVTCSFSYADYPQVRELILWWDKAYCEAFRTATDETTDQ